MISKVNWKEFFLWALFTVICFMAGYTKSLRPDWSWKKWFGNSQDFRLALQDDNLLTPSMLQILKEEFHVQIRIEKIKDPEQLKLETVTGDHYHLYLIPQPWSQNLVREKLLFPLSNIDEHVSADFVNHERQEKYFFPLFWAESNFIASREIKENSWLEVLNSKTISQFYLYSDPLMNNARLNSWPQLKNKKHYTQNLMQPTLSLDKSSVFEVSHIKADKLDKESYKVLSSNKNLNLIVWGLAIPINSPSHSESLTLLKALTDRRVAKKALEELPVATTLKKLETEPLELNQKASYLRNLQLKEML